MDVIGRCTCLLVTMVTVTQGFRMVPDQRESVEFQQPGTYRNCDLCSHFRAKRSINSLIPDGGMGGGKLKCRPNQLCRAVGSAGKRAYPRCIDASSLSPVFQAPICPRGSGDTAVTPDGAMITCSRDSECPTSFVCTSGACCRDVSQCEKVGNCPSSASFCGMNNECTSDSDCPGDAKCCAYPTCEGGRCISPFFTGR